MSQALIAKGFARELGKGFARELGLYYHEGTIFTSIEESW